MKNEIAVKDTPMPMRPRDYNGSQLSLIRKTVAKDATQEEFDMFVEICKRHGLDPFRKQIHLMVYNKDKADKRQCVIVTGIDGYRAIAKRTGTYRPAVDEAYYDFDDKAKDPESNPLGLIKAQVIIYQFGPDREWYPVSGVAHWKEFAPLQEDGAWVPMLDAAGNEILETKGQYAGRPKRKKVGNGKLTLTKDNWKNMPMLMLAKCAEAQALRKGWPEECSGLYIPEELDRMELEVSASDALEAFEKEERLKIVSGREAVPMIMDIRKGIEMVPDGEFYDRVLSTISGMKTKSEITVFVDCNRTGLQMFWARNKGDALDLKTKIEALKEKAPEYEDVEMETKCKA